MFREATIHKDETIEPIEKLPPYKIDIQLISEMRRIPDRIIPENGVVN